MSARRRQPGWITPGNQEELQWGMEHAHQQEDLSLVNLKPASCQLLMAELPQLPCCKNIVDETNLPGWIGQKVEEWKSGGKEYFSQH